MSSLVLRIKFPQTYPLIYKTLRVDPNLTVAEAVVYIAQTVSAPSATGVGLFLPSQKKWLGENDSLSTYPSLQEEEYIEYKDKNEKKAGLCIIL